MKTQSMRLRICSARSTDVLDLTEHTCRNDDAGVACDYETEAGNAELTKENEKDEGNEDKGEGGLTVKERPYENGYLRCDDHKLICEGVDELAEIGDEIILSRDLAVEHIGKGGESVNEGGNDKTPPLDLAHRKQGHDEHGNEKDTDYREYVRNVH